MTPKPAHWHRYGGRSVLVFDDLFPKDLVEALGIMLMRTPYEKRPSFDNELSFALPSALLGQLPHVPEVLRRLLRRYYGEMSNAQSPQKLSHLYCAALKDSDQTAIHRDIDCPDCVTFLYYASLHWDPSWGSETVFFDDQRDAMFAVAPRPGRLAMFNAQLFHRTGVPARNAVGVRFGLSIFFRCQKMLQDDAPSSPTKARKNRP